MDPSYNPHTGTNIGDVGDSILDEYNKDLDEFSIEDVIPGTEEDVNPYARTEAIASLPIPGINR